SRRVSVASRGDGARRRRRPDSRGPRRTARPRAVAAARARIPAGARAARLLSSGRAGPTAPARAALPLSSAVHAQTAAALVLALASTTLTNIAYLREHDAAVALPPLSLRRPLQSVRALLTDRSWLLGFALESSGFALYVLALALAPLSLVQSVAAGGIGILAYVSARLRRRR